MKIGITERGDASRDLSWVFACSGDTPKVDGAILITKDCSKPFRDNVLKLQRHDFPMVIHATCTGWGGTPMEPNVPNFQVQLENLKALINAGFPKENTVLRLDPIIPTKEGILRARLVLESLFQENKDLCGIRIRTSIMDGYRHALARMKNRGFDTTTLYFKPTNQQIDAIADMLLSYDFLYEVCAEPALAKRNPDKFIEIGCISEKDLHLMNLPVPKTTLNPQKRYGCKCLSCKTELLSGRNPCGHECAYCYWKD